jgi:glycosyltransferase involved in cell wall biosynthesis
VKRLSVIICCYNERETIRQVIERTATAEPGPGWEREIIVVDNYSTDGTRELLQAMEEMTARTIYHERNLGKGASIRSGIAAMEGDYFFIQDADGEYDPADQRRFCAEADRTGAAAIFGSRVLGGQVRYKYARAYWGVRFLTAMTNLLFGGRLTDVATASKMVRADLAKGLNLTCTGFDLDFELPDKILLSGNPILEIPISYDPRTYEQGKKIRAKDGMKALGIMIRDRLGLSPVWKQKQASPGAAERAKPAAQAPPSPPTT